MSQKKTSPQEKHMSKQLDAGIVHKFVKANRKLIPQEKTNLQVICQL